MGKFFTISVKPHIPALPAGQHGAFGDNEVLFDWHAFDIPKGASKLINATIEIRPRPDTTATMQQLDFEMYMAKTLRGEAPPSLGTVNSATTADTNYGGHLIWFMDGASWNGHEAHLDSTAFCTLKGNIPQQMGMVVQGEPDSGTNVGYDRIYLGGITAGAFDFRSLIRINNGVLDEDIFTVDGADPRLSFRPGDDIVAYDGSIEKALGTIKSMPDEYTIRLDATTETAAVDGDFIYNKAPITINLHFER